MLESGLRFFCSSSLDSGPWINSACPISAGDDCARQGRPSLEWKEEVWPGGFRARMAARADVCMNCTSAVEQTWDIQDSQGQTLALDFRESFLKPLELFPLRSQAVLDKRRVPRIFR